MNPNSYNPFPSIAFAALIALIIVSCIAGASITRWDIVNPLTSGENPNSTVVARQNTQAALDIATTGTVAAVQQTMVVMEQTAVPPRATLAAVYAAQTQAVKDHQRYEQEQRTWNLVLTALAVVLPSAIITSIAAFLVYLNRRVQARRLEAQSRLIEAEALKRANEIRLYQIHIQRDIDRKAHKPRPDAGAHPNLGEGDRKADLGGETRTTWPDDKDKNLGKGNLPRADA